MDPHGLELLPSWAIGTSSTLVLGSHLATRDGRKTGNAHVIWVNRGSPPSQIRNCTVLTDAGNQMVLSPEEIDGLFWPPKYVSDLVEVREKFSSR